MNSTDPLQEPLISDESLGITSVCFTKASQPEWFEMARVLRDVVFVQEQAVPEEDEWDDLDDTALHFLLMKELENEPVATGRIVEYQEACQARPVAKIGRVAVSAQHRGQRLGEKIMKVMMAHAKAQGYEYAILDAQTHALTFYEKLGFVKEGFEFMDAGIPHYRMRCPL